MAKVKNKYTYAYTQKHTYIHNSDKHNQTVVYKDQ